jgi:hypothetical protein
MRKIFFIIAFSFISSFFSSPFYAQDKKERTKVVIGNEENLPELSVTDNVLYVKNAAVGAKIEVITIVGSKVKEIKLKTSDASFELNLPRAIYIFKMEGIVRKFVIK